MSPFSLSGDALESLQHTEIKKQSLPLSELKTGQYAHVVEVDPANAFARRFQDLGFVSGSLVHIRQEAPLHDPIEIEVRGSRFCLRRSDAKDIHVTTRYTQKP